MIVGRYSPERRKLEAELTMATSTRPAQQSGTNQPANAGGRTLHGGALASVLIALMATLLLAALDQTIVSTALPTILHDLNGLDRYAWVGTAYLLTSTTMIPIFGKLSDQFGRKPFIVGGVIVFLLGSALCGVSQTMNQLIIFRAFQGIGAAAIQGQIFTVVGDIFTPAERPRWQGVFSTVFGFSSVIGPLTGGWISDNSSWRWVFYVNLPIGIIALILLALYLPANISIRTASGLGWAGIKRIDFSGSLLAAAGTVALLLGLTWGGNGPTQGGYAWSSPQVLISLILAAVLLIGFVVNEFFAKNAILPLHLFKNRVFGVDALLSLFFGMAFLSIIFYLPLFIQYILGKSATESGLVITPLTFALILASIGGGQMIARTGRYQWLLITGAILLCVGVFFLTRMSVDATLGDLTWRMIIVGLGLGAALPTLTIAAQNALPRNELGVGTGAVTYLRSLGSTLGIAILGTVVNNSFATEIANRLPAGASKLPPKVLAFVAQPQILAPGTGPAKAKIIAEATQKAVAQATANVPPAQQPAVTQQVTAQVQTLFDQIFHATKEAFSAAIIHGFGVALIICLVVLVGTFFLKDVPLRTSFAHPEAGKNGAADLPPPVFE